MRVEVTLKDHTVGMIPDGVFDEERLRLEYTGEETDFVLVGFELSSKLKIQKWVRQSEIVGIQTFEDIPKEEKVENGKGSSE